MAFGLSFAISAYNAWAAVGFSPLSLFADGEQGVWYDPSDYSSLFQDSAGTTPVTAVEQPVGLMLDKSQGLVLGPELVVNGDFSSGTGWTTDTGWAIGSGAANSTASGAGTAVYQPLTIVFGKTYKVTFTVSNYVSGSCFATLFDAINGPVITANGTYTQYLRKDSGPTNYVGVATLTAFTGSIDNITVKELPGNHAFQSTSASRPVLSARYNLLTKTEQLNDTSVQRNLGTVTANAGISPSGANNAFLFQGTGSLTGWDDYPTDYGSSSGVAQTFSISAKAGTTGQIRIELGSGFATFNVSTGMVVSSSTIIASISSQGNGWYRLSCTAVKSNQYWYWIVILDGGANTSNNAFLWGSSLVGPTLTPVPYQRVNTATDYDTVGFLPYLKFDGVDDSLSTNSIDFTSTDKMSVFAGVRKLSDAGFGGIVELSAEVASNNGSFLIRGPENGANYFVGSKGTGVVYRTLTTYTAPITNTITMAANISAPLLQTRINGATVDTSTATQGTGNYGNYPLFIGRRNNASLPFNGQLYSMVIVGKAVSAGELSSTEQYVNGKTGAY